MRIQLPRRVASALATAALAASAAAAAGVVHPAPASAAVSPAASSEGGKISADEVITRLKDWYDRKIPYSQSNYVYDIGKTHKYRTDCSGYADMALHTVHDWNTDSLATADSFHHVMNVNHDNRDQLRKNVQPGDVFDDTTNGHAFIFASWSSSDPKKFYYYNFGGGSSGTAPPEHHTGYVGDDEFGYEPANNYFVLRYNNIVQPSDPIKDGD